MAELICWLCEEDGGCHFPVCYEQEISDLIRREEEGQLDMFEGDKWQAEE